MFPQGTGNQAALLSVTIKTVYLEMRLCDFCVVACPVFSKVIFTTSQSHSDIILSTPD